MAISVHNLIVLSDVHLGSDLVHHAQPEAPRRGRSSERRDQDLAALFTWYREHPVDGRPWRLVIAGDFIDFAGMSVMTEATLETAPTEEERAHGLGGAKDHTLMKLRLVMEHDAAVMQSLAEFVAAGNSLVIVRGNHDVEWHWQAVQDEFRHALAARAPLRPEHIEFAPWFYYEKGVVYVEHGHQYDAYCSYEHVLHPVSPTDPRRTTRSLSDILLRYVVRPTRGMSEAGHAAAGMLDYLRFGARLGAGGMLDLARRFVRATQALFSLWREHVSEAARWIQREHDTRMEQLSRLHRIKLRRLRSLARLQRPPVTKSLLAILSSVMLDRVALGAVGALLATVLFLGIDSFWLASAYVLGASLLLVMAGIASRRLRHSLEPSAELRERSTRVARLFPAAFIVMGHTHLPETRPATADATYVNLGAWAEEDAPDGQLPSLPATRTHLVVQRVNGRPIAALLTWGPSGPEPFG